jgi:archaellum component FlaC
MDDKKNPWDVVSVAPIANQATTQANPWDVVQQTSQQPKYMGYGEMMGQAVSNIPASAGNMISGLYHAVTNPVQTVSGILDVGAGALQKALPKPVVDFVNQFESNPEAAQRAVSAANALGGVMKERYGSVEGIKNTIATDPVGAMGDLSTLLGGMGGMGRMTASGLRTGGANQLAQGFQKAGDIYAKASDLTNPITLAGKGVSKTADMASALVKGGLGLKTGVGTEPITQAVKAGREGNETFLENMRGTVPMTQVLDDAKSNLAKMNLDKQAEYRSGMVNIKNDKTQLDFTGIDQAIADAQKYSSYKGKVVNKGAADVLDDIKAKVDDWKNSDPAQYHTPEGIDKLKQSIWESIEKLPNEAKTAYSAAKEVYDSVKKEISKQAPEYSRVMSDYSQATEKIKEIERALSLGNKASADTAMRKLQSLMRNNVNTNYGNRLEMAKELEKAGGNEMMPALAGQALSDYMPRGIQRATTAPEGLLAYTIGGLPLAAADVLASSPRLVGEASYKYGQLANALGQATQPVTNLTGKVPMTAQQARLAALLAAQQPPRIELNNMLPNRP